MKKILIPLAALLCACSQQGAAPAAASAAADTAVDTTLDVTADTMASDTEKQSFPRKDIPRHC